MGDHNTRMQEFLKEVDNLKGSMEGVVNSVAEMRNVVDDKVAQATKEIKRMLLGNVNNTTDQQTVNLEENGNLDRGGRRNGDYQLPTRGYQVELPKFDEQVERSVRLNKYNFFSSNVPVMEKLFSF